MKTPKIIVYTVNIGGYDNLHPYKDWNEPCEKLYFTDGDAPDGWTKVEHPIGGRKESRHLKINSHLLPPHDISIYIDSCFHITGPLTKLVKMLGKADIALPPHPHKTLAKHAEMCILLGLDDEQIINEQMTRYGEVNTPLTENGIIVRRNTPKIKELNELWWQEYQSGSQRDQLSLPYAIQQTNAKLTLLPFSARNNKFLSGWCQHKHVNR